MRGYSACQVHFAHEIHMDEVANSLGIDPLELRRENEITPYYTGPTGLEFTSCKFDECLTAVADYIDWEHRDRYPLGSGEGVGLSGSGFMSGTGFPVLVTPHYCSSTTIVRLNREGYAVVFSGANDIGMQAPSARALPSSAVMHAAAQLATQSSSSFPTGHRSGAASRRI